MQHPIVLQDLYEYQTSGPVLPEPAHQTENLLVYFDTATEILHVKWQGQVNTPALRAGYVQILRMVQRYKPTKWVLDLQNRALIEKQDQQWVFKQIFPKVLRLVQSDVFIAVILPVYLYESMIHDLDGDEFIDNDNLLIMHHFLYYEECLRWLQGEQDTGARA